MPQPAARPPSRPAPPRGGPAASAGSGARADRAAGDGRSTADRILDAAEDCFARKGFDGTTLRDVADIVGIRIPSLYNHFDGKQSLYAAVLARGMTPILDLLTDALASGGEVGATDPRAFVADVMALLAERPNLPRLVQYEMLAGGDELAMMLEGWLRPTMDRSLALLRDTPAAVHWKPEQLPLLLLALVNMLIGHFAMTPLAEQLLGHDVRDAAAVERATGFYGRAAALLTFGGAEAPAAPAPDEEPAP